MQPEPIEGRCNARTRDAGYCKNWPTKAHGRRCRMHGGAPGSGRPIIHGKYSKAMRAELRDHYSQALEDEPESLDLADELAFIRALIMEFQSRFIEGIPQTSDDVGLVIGWLANVSQVANRASLIQSRSALTVRQVALLETVIVHLLAEFLGPRQREAFTERLSEALNSMPVLQLSESEDSIE